jgi:hypothetical protein
MEHIEPTMERAVFFNGDSSSSYLPSSVSQCILNYYSRRMREWLERSGDAVYFTCMLQATASK